MDAFLLALFGGLLGLVAGSFLATLVVRWPRGESILGRSHCDGCGRQLRAAELVPALSWAVLGGRCQGCDSVIDRRHIRFELAAALIGVVALLAAPNLAGLGGALLGWLLLALLALDTEHYWLPDRLTLPLLTFGIAFGAGPLTDRLLGAALAGGLLLALACGYRLWKGRHGLGLGDVKLAAALGAWLGPLLVGPLLGLAALLGLFLAIVQGRLSADTRIPFGACLAAAGFPLWLLVSASAIS